MIIPHKYIQKLEHQGTKPGHLKIQKNFCGREGSLNVSYLLYSHYSQYAGKTERDKPVTGRVEDSGKQKSEYKNAFFQAEA